MRKLFPLFLLVLVACSDATGPDPVDPVSMTDVLTPPAHISKTYAPSTVCSFGIGVTNQHRSLACWSAFLIAMGATITQGGACTLAFAKPSQATVGACVTAIGGSVGAWNNWQSTADRDGWHDWAGDQMHNDACRRMGREAGC